MQDDSSRGNEAATDATAHNDCSWEHISESPNTQRSCAQPDRLVKQRDDFAQAAADFRWPDVGSVFDWGIDWFDQIGRGNPPGGRRSPDALKRSFGRWSSGEKHGTVLVKAPLTRSIDSSWSRSDQSGDGSEND